MIKNALNIWLLADGNNVLKNLIRDFICFGLKQAYACIFGGALLFGILATKLFWTTNFPIARYDFLFFYAVTIQICLIAFKLETWREARVIVVFHIVGTIMEIFKTHVGSWSYPENNLIRVADVPLFSGFMYSAVGSYMARVWRLFSLRFDHYPAQNLTILLCVLIYLNFFTHHYVPDIRIGLFVFCAILYFRTMVYFTPARKEYRMPLLIGFLLVSLFIWIAENVGTFGAIWIYPTQHAKWHIVSFSKLGSWYLLMIISFVLVNLLNKKIACHKQSVTHSIKNKF